jgi:hypothetical protein
VPDNSRGFEEIANPMEQIEYVHRKLAVYCRQQDWAGHDPYDALNSRLLASIPFLNNRITNIAFTQILKRLPVDLRPLLRVSKEQNPKAMALFLMSFVKSSRFNPVDRCPELEYFVDRLVALRSPFSPYWCWGYNFPWQSRYKLVPKAAPNLVCTVFVAEALLDAFEARGEEYCFRMAINAGEYIVNELYWSGEHLVAGFCYPLPSFRSQIHNANLLGAALLCRLYQHTGEKRFLDPAMKVVRYSAGRQKDDGSWNYGEMEKYRWVDNFHTGYNLCALRSIGRYAGTTEFEEHVRKGFEFYRTRFFREDGAPGYYHDRTYPIDIHCAAQSIITPLCLKDLDRGNFDLSLSVFSWAMKNMWDDEGFFYYQLHPHYRNKISYMRWSQAWMLLALSTILEEYRLRQEVYAH